MVKTLDKLSLSSSTRNGWIQRRLYDHLSLLERAPDKVWRFCRYLIDFVEDKNGH